jgi:hypothetical protein
MADTVKFNVGGQVYEVSRSLLDQHPRTLLSTLAPIRKSNPESEIVIDRQGLHFQYVLDFLRDGRVRLPSNESKDAVIKELEFYGVTFDKAQIDVTTEDFATCLSSIQIFTKDLQSVAVAGDCAQIAVYCLTAYIWRCVQDSSPISKPSGNRVLYHNWNERHLLAEAHDDCRRALGRSSKLLGSYELLVQGVNIHLNRVGLQLVSQDLDSHLSVGPVLQDESIHLPSNESKDAILKEWQNCGVAFDTAQIDDTKGHSTTCVSPIESLTKDFHDLVAVGGCADVAIYYLNEYLRRHEQATRPVSWPSDNVLFIYLNTNDQAGTYMDCYNTVIRMSALLGSQELVIQGVNIHLNRVGLKLVSWNGTFNAQVDDTEGHIAICVSSMGTLIKELQGAVEAGGCADIAIYCFKEYLKQIVPDISKMPPQDSSVIVSFVEHDPNEGGIDRYKVFRRMSQLFASSDLLIQELNIHLNRFGLQVVLLESASYYTTLTLGHVDPVMAAA